MDLIYAEASPPGRGGVSILRISGNGAREAMERLAGAVATPRHASLRILRDGDDELDHALVIWFEAGHSFTGEEVAELHLHGAPVIARRVSQALQKMGIRQAIPGEFTRRAYLNGRMDLAAVEGLGDLLVAETEVQRKLALANTTGALSKKVDDWRKILIRAGALVEVSVDFADEDVPDDVPAEVFVLLSRLCDDLEAEINGFGAAERILNGFDVAIIGAPNAGKSSLLNRIARREVALVSPIAGTTRDVIEIRVEIGGLPVTLLDTAGLRDTVDIVEQMGVERARERAIAADLRVHLTADGKADKALFQPHDLVVVSKADLGGTSSELKVSSATGEGIDRLIQEIHARLSTRVAGAGLIMRERQRQAVSDACEALQNVENQEPEIVAELIRQAAVSLDTLVGRIGAEDYLDAIFSSFCIGK